MGIAEFLSFHLPPAHIPFGTAPEVTQILLCRPGDPRLAQKWGDSGGWEQAEDEPLMLVIGQKTSDEKCARLAGRFGLRAADLIAFRDSKNQPRR